MSDNDQEPILSTRLYNALLKTTTPSAYDKLGWPIYTSPPARLNLAVIRRAIEDGSIYHWRNIGPKSVAQIKRWLAWLADHPATETMQPTSEGNTMTCNSDPTIRDIMNSLAGRGFLQEINYFDPEAIQTQFDAVVEELGEIARCLRRARQSHSRPDIDQLAVEAADVVIAATCLLATVADISAPRVLAAKLEADDKRLWLHSGLTREQYEQRGKA